MTVLLRRRAATHTMKRTKDAKRKPVGDAERDPAGADLLPL